MNELTTQPAVGMTGVDPAASLLQILQKIQQLQGQPVVPDNPLAQIGTALSGMASGIQGRPNPVLNQFAQQRQMDLSTLQQQAGIAGQMATIQHQKTQEDAQKRQEERQREGALDAMVAKLIAADNPSVRLYGGQIMKKQLKDRGIEVPDDVVVGLATGKMDMTRLKEIATMRAAGYPLDVISASAGVAPDVIMQSDSLLQNDDSRKLLGLPTLSEQRKLAMDETLKDLDIAEKRLKLNDPGVSKNVVDMAVRMFKKRPKDITPDEWGKAADAWFTHDLQKAVAGAGAQPTPADTSRAITGAEAAVAAADAAVRMLADPKTFAAIKPFVGPMLTGAPFKEAWQRNAPESLAGGPVPPELTDLGLAEDTYLNLLAVGRSGLAVTETELIRLKKEAPTRSKDKPEVYVRKWIHAQKVAAIVAARLKQLSVPGGRGNIEAAANVLRSNPLPGPLALTAKPDEIYVKHKDGRIGVAKQGEKLDPGWEPIP